MAEFISGSTKGADSPLWVPSAAQLEGSRMSQFAAWVEERHGLSFTSYGDLHRWSIQDLGVFWSDVAEFFGVAAGIDPRDVLTEPTMPGATWFPGVELNFAELALRNFVDTDTALVFVSEGRPAVKLTAADLRRQVAGFAETLRELGVQPGDRVAGMVANTPHAVVAMLGTAAVGAIWCACSPDFGMQGLVERFGQTDPVVMVACDGYRYGGRDHDRRPDALRVLAQLATTEACIWVDYLHPGDTPSGCISWQSATTTDVPLEFESVPFAHPLWILFSSGTTGAPKGIMHGHGGVALEQLKAIGLHMDVGPGDRFFWYTSTAWMMWNVVVSSLLTGATAVLYDGSPHFPDLSAQWQLAETHGITYLGTSAGYLTACARAGLSPGDELDLASVRAIGSTGSPLPAATARWVSAAVGEHVMLASATGGTDVVTGFLGGSPLLPVYAGEISGPMLGVSVEAWDPDGHELVESEGELVVTMPMPSMPIGFWADDDGARYRESYFEMYPGVWRHGDWLEFTPRGTAIISGRSDSTLNRGGVRMGTADVYAVLDAIEEIDDSIMLGVEQPDGGYWMPLFVVVADDVDLDDQLRARIADRIGARVSRRHVPDEIVRAPAIPRTKTGKRLEVPLKRLFQGVAVEEALNQSAVDLPDSLHFYVELARQRSAARSPDGPVTTGER